MPSDVKEAPSTQRCGLNAWEAIQVRPVKSIVAEIFEQMEGRSNGDPTSPWADLALALCERISFLEKQLAERKGP